MTTVRTSHAEAADQERLRIFDSRGNPIGTATRADVHEKGYYHEAFHCWFVNREDNTYYIYLQLRSEEKKDHPGLFDITAAGHLTAEETVVDGVREIHEELGIDVSFDALHNLGIIPYHLHKEGFIDNELAHVFLYQQKVEMNDFKLQKEETSGMVKTPFNDFSDLWSGKRETVSLSGIQITKDGHSLPLKISTDKNMFVPHEVSFYQAVMKAIQEKLI